MSALTPTAPLAAFELTPTLPGHAPLPATGPGADPLGLGLAESDLSPAARSAWKRALDIVGALGGLIALGPLMLVVALAVRLDSAGPALFRQVRLGRNGRPFWCLKFRTMTTDAEHRLRDLEAQNEVACGVLFKIRRDPRVTRLGRFLRRTSLDELPQLANVLRGEMSLVGPRPLQLRDCQKLDALDRDRFARRLTTTPGITGPWQVGGRSDIDGHKMLDLDLGYIRDWSHALDLRIILRTIVVVLAGRGAC